MNCRKLGATAAAALLLAAALVIALPGGALGGTARSATNSQTFPDSTGENPAAPDITVDSSGNPDFSNSAADFAPDAGHGTYSYKVLTKLTLSVVVFTTTPKPARAGKLFAAGLAVTESDTGGPVKSGTVTCAATV